MKTLETLFTVSGVPVVFATNDRVGEDEQKDGFYYYNLRYSEYDLLPYSLEKKVWVNHYGTIATLEPIKDIEISEELLVNLSYELSDEEIDEIIQYI